LGLQEAWLAVRPMRIPAMAQVQVALVATVTAVAVLAATATVQPEQAAAVMVQRELAVLELAARVPVVNRVRLTQLWQL
jgi:hypothetical protein